MIKVRFAPSPTGYLHIGGARTALFNWMYARTQGGKFVLRIEDTDTKRSTKEFEKEILDSMKWLGLNWDELYYQSQRFDIYRKYARQLLDDGKAYKDGDAVILTMPQQEVKLYDVIRGEITFDTATLKDQVLLKSDGSPTYSFACVVDDALMEISCVIRGEDHISNTPKQIIICHALGFKIPKFAHLPLIMDETGGRLSKRTGAVAVSDYRKNGFLPEALMNYLMLLGWSPGNDQEIITPDAAIKKFTLKKINKTAAAFSIDKLTWINNQYIKQLSTDQLSALLIPILKEKNYIDDTFDLQKLKNIIELFKGRLPTLADFVERADFLFIEKITMDAKDKAKHLIQDRTKEFSLLSKCFNDLDSFDIISIETAFRGLVDDLGLKASDLVHPMRIALTGRAVGPSLFETIAVLGKEKTQERLLTAFKN